MLRISAFALLLTASTASADLDLRFDEGAPKDRFSISNKGSCPLPAMEITLDLGTAPVGLIFDVTSRGAGVQVYQPFELVAGAEHLSRLPVVVDGDTAIVLELTGLGVGQSVAFTIDVDDTGGASETIISGTEIAGATVRAALSDQLLVAIVGSDATATIPLAACTS